MERAMTQFELKVARWQKDAENRPVHGTCPECRDDELDHNEGGCTVGGCGCRLAIGDVTVENALALGNLVDDAKQIVADLMARWKGESNGNE